MPLVSPCSQHLQINICIDKIFYPLCRLAPSGPPSQPPADHRRISTFRFLLPLPRSIELFGTTNFRQTRCPTEKCFFPFTTASSCSLRGLSKFRVIKSLKVYKTLKKQPPFFLLPFSPVSTFNFIRDCFKLKSNLFTVLKGKYTCNAASLTKLQLLTHIRTLFYGKKLR